jgi:anti-sigma factor RsiW
MEHLDSSILWQYVAGESGNAQTARIKKHLSGCESCRREYELLRQIEATLHIVDEEVPAVGFADAVIQKIENETVLERKNVFWVKFLPYVIPGGFVLAFLLAIIVGTEVDLDVSRVESALSGQVVIVILTACILLWGFYVIDRICKKIFVPVEYA